MSVESVNNSNNNAGLYAAGAATIGAGAGAAAGWYSKPFLKDGTPTDSFLKSMTENIKNDMSKEEKELAEAMDSVVSEFKNGLNNANTVEEFKNCVITTQLKGVTEEKLGELKAQIQLGDDFINGIGMKSLTPETLEKISNAESIEDLKTVLGEAFDKEYAGKTLDELKNAANEDFKTLERKSAKSVFDLFWDSSKKEFVDCEEGVGKAIKKAARGIQTKYAAIYGGIAAAVLGIGTYLLTNNNKSEEQPEKVDTQA